MTYRYHFGFKLSTSGKNRLAAAVQTVGYTVVDAGWDYLELDRRITLSDFGVTSTDALIRKMMQYLFYEEVV